jgi:DNA polymerase-4
MSCAEAARRCPHAVFVRPRHTLYREYSQAVWAAVREVVPAVERTGLDEGYLDFAGLAAEFGRARVVAEAVQTSVRAATSLSCSLGVAPSKVVAKVASDRRKPGGITVVPPGTEARFLAPLAVRKLPGVGPRAEERLRAAGITTVGALAALSDLDLRALLPGQVGRMLRDRAKGIDGRALEQSAERVSISVEETFERDLHDRSLLHAELRRMADRLGEHLRREGLAARTVTTKLRYGDFSIRSRSTSLDVGIDDATRIGELACGLLDRGLRDRPGALRLVGVGLSGLADHRQLSFEDAGGGDELVARGS